MVIPHLRPVEGADETVNYNTEDLKARIRELTGGQGADVVYDPVGGRYSEPALRSTAWDVWRRASARVVLPLARCPTRAMVRMSLSWYFNMLGLLLLGEGRLRGSHLLSRSRLGPTNRAARGGRPGIVFTQINDCTGHGSLP